jgi:hypothetical protein
MRSVTDVARERGPPVLAGKGLGYTVFDNWTVDTDASPGDLRLRTKLLELGPAISGHASIFGWIGKPVVYRHCVPELLLPLTAGRKHCGSLCGRSRERQEP